MPFARSVVDEWQVGSLEEHYRAVLGEIPYAAEEDDLAGHFPLLGRADPLPPLTKRSLNALANYDRHRRRLQRWGITMGKARLAMRGSSCVLAGLCHTGCPYGLVYSASHTFDRLRSEGASGLVAPIYRLTCSNQIASHMFAAARNNMPQGPVCLQCKRS